MLASAEPWEGDKNNHSQSKDDVGGEQRSFGPHYKAGWFWMDRALAVNVTYYLLLQVQILWNLVKNLRIKSISY